MSLDNCPALVLNADFRPLSYFPLSVWSWQEVVKAVFLDRVNIISEYEEVVRSPSFEMRLPIAWNGRFFYQANGGLDGNVVTATGEIGGGGPTSDALNMGFAVISSDAGPTGACLSTVIQATKEPT